MIQQNMRRALEVALTSSLDIKMGCVVTDRKGRVIAEGTNKSKTHPLQYKHAVRCGSPHKVFLHAEISALVKCREQGHTLYVGRWRGDGRIGLAKPCPICFSAMDEAGIKTIIYTENGGNISIIKIGG